VATILSARTKDDATAKAAGKLFKKAPDLASLAQLGEAEIAKLIYPVGFFNNKAGYLKKLPRVLSEQFDGIIPDDLDALQKLPGVGRKTANLVRSVAFDKPAICVDTHVHRIMNIWGYVTTKTPLETEMALREKLPNKYWKKINSLLVAFGQTVCLPVRPHCDVCPIETDCPRLGVTPRRLPGKQKKPAPGTALRMVSWNVNGLRAITRKGFSDIVLEMNPDLLALQEIKATPEQLDEEIRNLDGYHAFWHPAEKKGYSGTCVYSRKKPLQVVYGLGIEEHDREGRVLTLEYSDFFFVNAYFPNAQHGLARLDYKLAFNRDLQAFVRKLAQKKTVILCGDFNVAHKEIDLANPKQNEKNPGFTSQERAWMDEFLAAGYLDTFRIFNKEAGQYSWWSYRFNARARNIGWRIDYFCIDKKSRQRVQNAAILKEIPGSDHCPVQIDFR
jgi:exodeoxyribonuclease-3